jgi:glycolate oxidase
LPGGNPDGRIELMSAAIAPLARRLRAELGAAHVVTDEAERRTFACDGLAHYRTVPALVVLPESAEQVALVWCACCGRGEK